MIKRKNNKGLRCLPWGTREGTLIIRETILTIFIYYFRPEMYDLIYPRKGWPLPRKSNSLIMLE